MHKAVDVEGQLHIIEELQAFQQEPVNSVLISEKQVASSKERRGGVVSSGPPSECAVRPQMSVYLTSPSGVVQLPLSSCQRYASCYDCIFARDPHCAWNQTQCVEITSHTNRSVLMESLVYLDNLLSTL